MLRIAVGSILLLGAVSGEAQAQYLTDAGSPLGSGGGASSQIGAYVAPSNPASLVARSGGRGNPLVSTARSNLIAALGGNPAALIQALGGSPQATALGQSLAALGPSPSAQGVIAAIQAHNALVDAPPTGMSARVNLAVVTRLLIALGANEVDDS